MSNSLEVQDVKCPECERLSEVAPVSQKIGEFLDWLEHEKGWRLAEHHEHSDDCDDGDCGYRKDELQSVYVSREKILAEFFQIDLDKVETERRALLDAIRQRYAVKEEQVHG